MSYRFHLLASAKQGMVKASAASWEPQADTLPSLAGPGADGTAWPGIIASRLDEYTLPAGIVSLEHWLDLNA